MHRRGRSLFAVALVALATVVVGVSVAWACTGPGYGTPSSPAPPPSDPPPPDQAGGSPSGTAPAPSGGGEPAPAPAPEATGTTPGSQGTAPADSRSVSGAGGRATNPSPGEATQPAGGGADSPAVPVTEAPSVPADTGEQFAARESGATAGVVSEGGQQVFGGSRAKGRAAGGSDAPASSPSERSAVGDAWSGFDSGASAAGSAAPAASLGEEGSGSTFGIGMAILAFGLVGMLGTFLVLAASRRRRVTVEPEGTSRRGRGPSGQ